MAEEVKALVKFKTSTLTATGFKRYSVWSKYTAEMKVRRLGLWFGALAAPPTSAVAGLGVKPSAMTLALFISPRFCDWFLVWRERRRGFFTLDEVNFLSDIVSWTRPGSGWLRQNPKLAKALKPTPGLISRREIDRVQKGWDSACDAAYHHAMNRLRDVKRATASHRDNFQAVLAVLEADSPLGEYRKIADEVLKRMPDLEGRPLEYAEAARAFLLLRLGMHLGVRQKNLRELLYCPKGLKPRSEHELRKLLRGELRWDEKIEAWEIFIPYQAFKNHFSTFFEKKPFRLTLPDIAGLYPAIDAYLLHHRPILLGPLTDPGTFFVRTARRLKKRRLMEYSMVALTDAWKVAVQRYGIHNPYTGRGAIKGLLPHGPHGVRDVLATHIIKQTGSYELASYAIQSTPEVVEKHYARFLPQDKAARAAEILNRVWATGVS